MRITPIAIALASILQMPAQSMANDYDLLSTQAEQINKNKATARAEKEKIKRSSRVDGSKPVYISPVLKTPQYFWANPESVPFSRQKKANISAEQLNRKAGDYYINQYQQLLGLSGKAKRGLKYQHASQTSRKKSIITHYKQYVNDIPVLGGGVNLLMDNQHKLISVSANLAPQVLPVDSEQNFSVTENKAIAIAMSDLIKTVGF